jgi:PIN domain nuclease of toxin-antitoxin system
MNCILDTHFLLWIASRARRLAEFPWIEAYLPWGVSPVSFLEIEFLHEIGRLDVKIDGFIDAVMNDSRLVVDELSMMTVIQQALGLEWTRDPFDRLLVAHSRARRKPLCTTDRLIRRHHVYVPSEMTLQS